MKALRSVAIAATFAIASCGIAAQNLSTEVVVDRSIQPDDRAATRLSGLWPSVILPQTRPISLNTANYNDLSEILRTYTHLNPSDGSALPLDDSHRGYLVADYFPVYNVGVSAGYRAIANERTTLDIWTQFDGSKYSVEDYSADMKYTGVRAGANLSTLIANDQRLDASLEYQYANSETYWHGPQKLNHGMLRAAWSRQNTFSYDLGFKIGADTYSDYDPQILGGTPSILKGFSAIYWGAKAGVNTAIAEQATVGAEADADFMDGLGVIEVRPYYTLKYDNFRATVALKASAIVDNGWKFKIAPDLTLGWNPSSKFGLQATVTGGASINSAYTMRQVSPYIIGYEAAPSDIPVDAELRMLFGPQKGFSVELFGGYAVANDWLMASFRNTFYPLQSYDVKTWHAGAKLNYRCDWLTASVTGETAPSDETKAYFRWRDRAKYVIGAHLEVKPIAPLTIAADYEFRGHRIAFNPNKNSGISEQFGLGCASDLSVHASYAFNANFSVFATGENLLDRRYDILPVIANQGRTALAGFALKF